MTFFSLTRLVTCFKYFRKFKKFLDCLIPGDRGFDGVGKITVNGITAKFVRNRFIKVFSLNET